VYYTRTDPAEIAEALWWLAEGVDISDLERKTGYQETTLRKWLNRAGKHGARWQALTFRNLTIDLIQMDELYAKVKDADGARGLWSVIDPVSKALPALHLGGRRSEDAYSLVHELKGRLHPACVPAFTTDGLRAYFHAVTAHFGWWFRPPRARKDHWHVHDELCHGQLIKRRERRKVTYTITRMLWGKRSDLYDLLEAHGFRRLIQTAFIERVNLTIRQGVSLLTRRTWSLPQTDQHWLNHVEWWRGHYHWIRPHQPLREPVPGEKRRHRDRTPAMALGLTDHIWPIAALLRTPVLTRLAVPLSQSRQWRGFGGVRASYAAGGITHTSATGYLADVPLTIHQDHIRPFAVQIHTQVMLIHHSSLFADLISLLSVYQVEGFRMFLWYQAAPFS
jgi:IS1 family transposase